MLSKECNTDLNFIMNHLIQIGGQMKACYRDFKKTDKGVAVFLKAEAMERYELSGEIGDYIQDNGGKVIFYAEPAPQHNGATVQTLQVIIPLEEATLTKLQEFIASSAARGSEKTKSYMVYLHNMCQYEYNEFMNVYNQVKRIASDPGSMNEYNIFLEKKYEYGEESNSCGEYK